jgi:hypothetical protein
MLLFILMENDLNRQTVYPDIFNCINNHENGSSGVSKSWFKKVLFR